MMTPTLIQFAIPYDDGSGNALEVNYGGEDLEIGRGGDKAIVPVADLFWLQDALASIVELCGITEADDEEEPETSEGNDVPRLASDG